MANYNSVHSGQEIDAAVSAVQEKEDNWDGKAEQADLSAHTADKDNPHEVDPEQIGAIPETEKGAAGGVATLGSDGKVPTGQLPAMNYDPAGSAAAVQQALSAHTADKGNPHEVDAEQTGALPITGGTMTGFILLHANPTQEMHPATMGYVDNKVDTIVAEIEAALASV